MILQPLELDVNQPKKRCDHCGQLTRCGGQTIGSVGPSYFYCLGCLCGFMVSLPPA